MKTLTLSLLVAMVSCGPRVARVANGSRMLASEPVVIAQDSQILRYKLPPGVTVKSISSVDCRGEGESIVCVDTKTGKQIRIEDKK